MDNLNAVRGYYDGDVEHEWTRIDSRPEFLLTCRFLTRYIRPGDRVLDIGGGPGSYALWLAARGCDVTLLDLSPGNVHFALARAEAQHLPLQAVTGDARTADTAVHGPFDHVLLMGPLYHLLKETDRAKAVEAALRLLKPKGILYASFISLYAGLIYAMKNEPACILSDRESEVAYFQSVLQAQSYSGNAFTDAFFIKPTEIRPFMERFPLQTLHLFGQEGILAPCEHTVMPQSKEIVDAWLNTAETLSERPELYAMAEHLMYIGRKN